MSRQAGWWPLRPRGNGVARPRAGHHALTLPLWLRSVERDGLHCAGLIVLGGAAFGAGLVRLLVGPMGLNSATSLQALVLAVLHLLGPLVVALMALARLMPAWILRGRAAVGRFGLLPLLLPPLLLGSLLLILFLMVVLWIGMLMTPRADLVGEWGDVMAAIPLPDLLAAMLRSGLFLVAAAAVGLWTGRREGHGEVLPAVLVADAILQATVSVFALKLLWILVQSQIGQGS